MPFGYLFLACGLFWAGEVSFSSELSKLVIVVGNIRVRTVHHSWDGLSFSVMFHFQLS